MTNCDFWNHFLNSFLQLTPWVQIILGGGGLFLIAALAFFTKDLLNVLICSIVEWKHGYQ